MPPDSTVRRFVARGLQESEIRDFVGLADYDWDFNTPGAIPGFGPLEMSDEVRRQVVQMIGSSLTGDGLDKPAPAHAEAQPERSPIETSIELAATTPATPTEQFKAKVGWHQESPPATTVKRTISARFRNAHKKILRRE